MCPKHIVEEKSAHPASVAQVSEIADGDDAVAAVQDAAERLTGASFLDVRNADGTQQLERVWEQAFAARLVARKACLIYDDARDPFAGQSDGGGRACEPASYDENISVTHGR